MVNDQEQMKMKRESEKKNENQGIFVWDNAEAWDNSAHSHKVIQIEQNFEKK